MTEIWKEPNKYARAGRLIPDKNGNGLTVEGYNSYYVTNETIVPSDYSALIQKSAIMRKHITNLDNNTFLDLGCSTGYYSILARFAGAKQIMAVDMDSKQIDILSYVAEWFDWKNIETHIANVQDWQTKADVVLALALIHWIYSCTALIGSLDAAVRHLADLTNNVLYIEWVGLDDESMQWFKHTEYNKDIITESYTKDKFICALRKYFKSHDFIGAIARSREIYRCVKR